MVFDLSKEFVMKIKVQWVSTSKNKSDCLTRVKRSWVTETATNVIAVGTVDIIREEHRRHHLGVDKTWCVLKKLGHKVTREDIDDVVKDCRECQSIDPSPKKWKEKSLEVAGSWVRVACDTTYSGKRLYLTMVDCGPSRFAIWKNIIHGDAVTVTSCFENVFLERGAPEELLLDNSATFHSDMLKNLCEKWG